LDPHARRAPRGLEPDQIAQLFEHDDFAIAGRQVLGDFAHVVEASGHVIVLADAQGRIFLEIGNPKTMLGLEEVNLSPGGLWCERAVGPNGIGSALLRGRPCYVFGPEHFCEGWHPWVCYGSPVRDPVSGRALGAVDISGPALQLDRSAFNFTLSLARSIERALANVALERRHALLEEFLRAIRRWPGEGIVAVDEEGRIVHFSTEAARLAGGQDGARGGEWINRPLEALLARLGVKADLGVLRHEPGQWESEEMVLHYWPVIARERMLGALLVMRPADARPRAAQRYELQAPGREPARLARCWCRGRHRSGPGGARRAIRGPQRAYRPADRRNRHRQGALRPGDPRRERPRRRAFRRRQLRRFARRAGRERAVRLRSGRVHRRAARRRAGQVRAGAGRNDLPGRNRPDAGRPAGQAAAGGRDPHLDQARRRAAAAARRADYRGFQRGPPRPGGAGEIPPRPLLSPRRVAGAVPAAARARRGRRPAGQGLSRPRVRRQRTRRANALARGRVRPARLFMAGQRARAAEPVCALGRGVPGRAGPPGRSAGRDARRAWSA